MRARYTGGGVRFHVDDITPIGGTLGQPVDIGGITDLDVSSNIGTETDRSGLLFTQTRSITEVAPMVDFTTISLRQLFTFCTLRGFCYGAGEGNVDPTHPGLEVYGRRQRKCNDPAGGPGDAKYTSDAGFMLLNELTANAGADASCSAMSHTLSTAGADPLVAVFNSTVPTTFIEEQFTLGRFIIAGTEFTDEVEGISLNFGLSLGPKRPDLGESYPQSVGVRKIEPTLTIRCQDPSILASLQRDGVSCAHSDTIIQLRKREDRGKLIAFDTAEHITISMDGMLISNQLFRSSGEDDATNEYTLFGMDDGTNDPVVINPSSAYTLDYTP